MCLKDDEVDVLNTHIILISLYYNNNNNDSDKPICMMNPVVGLIAHVSVSNN